MLGRVNSPHTWQGWLMMPKKMG